MIIMDSVVIPKPPLAPPLPPLNNNNPQNQLHSTNSNGFRLLDDQNDTGSIYSVYKQKIDSMFESDTSVRTDAPTVPPAQQQTVPTKNCVQARIERMFTDVAKDTGVPINANNVHIFSVDYLGSVQLGEKVTSLDGLQVPLKELYFPYKKKHIRTNRSILTGRLEISNLGLKVHYQGDKGDLEQMNSFPTIAVWSAVKFVMQQQQQSGRKLLKFAFLPLITDPDNFDKANLFKELEENDRKFIRIEETHSPLFAVVMRKIGVQKQLECHGFVCQTSEDAIVIAATLYKSLMAHMKAKEMRPKNRNGITCMSIASTLNDKSSNVGGGVPVRPPRKKRSTTSSTISETDGLDTSDTQPLLQKTPKKSTKTRRAPKAPEDLDAILPYEEPIANPNNGTNNSEDIKIASELVEVKPKSFSDKISTYMSREQKQITAEIKQVMSGSTNRGLKHVPTLLRSSNNNQKDKNGTGCNSSPGGSPRKENSGDILTKVTIPRSGSFLNAGGLTRYKSKVSRGNGQMTGGSPLGFSELFNEFRLQEGLHSMDEILGVIIDPEGMSFNDLKPIYKEFLLKLSVTLTKDELYQRAKMIMRRQRKKALKRSTNNPNASKTFVSNRFKRLKHIFQKKLKIRDKPSRKVLGDEELPCKVPESTISTSSYDTRQFQPKTDFANAKAEKKSEYHRKKSDFRISTSEDSDFFSLRRKHKYRNGANNQHRNSSSGYVSCSECSYDSDTCTCTSADKCYCSLGNDKNNNSTHLSKNGTLTYCGCDTDSCTDSNKCYCSKDRGRRSIFGADGKKKKRYSEEYHKHKKVCKKLSNSRSTRSLEYMHNPVEAYYEKLLQQKPAKSKSVENYARGSQRRRNLPSEMGVDYDLFNRNRQLYGGGSASVRSYGFHKHRTKDSMLPTTALDPDNCFEAISVKKSAEIAALFADMKLSQTTDIKHLSQHNYDALNAIISSKNMYNRLKTQNSLVYSHQNGSQNPMPNQKMVQNTLYARNAVKNTSLYSAQNGLYTIQSQSDESRRSSLSDSGGGRVNKQKKKKSSKNFDYYELDSGNNLSNSLENSLGYLP